MKQLTRKVEVARRHGAGSVSKALTLRALRFPLWLVYRPEKWHLRGFHTTNYKKMAVALAHEVPAPLNVVVDVGCGLGEILNRVDAPRRIGLDVEPGVISWARLLQRFTRSDVEFRAGSFESLTPADPEVIDLVIALGWFHYMADEWIEDRMRTLLATRRVRYVMVDEFPAQAGRIEGIFDDFGEPVRRCHDWQDGKTLFLYRCDG
ncbi:class I SAM-dependent methyltransferase [Planotetraspora silvatica]|nr:class I SAM-dependent methyltransferase [Planotetraspora silvatica]